MRTLTWNGSCCSRPSFTYVGRKVPASSREKPNVICVRSFVPKEKNSVCFAMAPAAIDEAYQCEASQTYSSEMTNDKEYLEPNQ